MTSKILSRRRLQHGVNLLEMAVAISVLALMSGAIVAVMQGAQQTVQARITHESMTSAEDALYGFALSFNHLPTPDGAVPSSVRIGFTEGWLPMQQLGLPTRQRIRYLVDSSLLNAPSSLYNADPLALAGALIKPRTDANGFDFCMLLMQQDQSGLTLPGGRKIGFALQEVPLSAATADTTREVWLGDSEAVTASPQAQWATRTTGYLDAESRIGCVPRMATLAAGVRSTIAAADLLKLAEQNVVFRSLAVKEAGESFLNHVMRLSIFSLGESIVAVKLVLTYLQLEEGVAAAGSFVSTESSQLAFMAAIAIFLDQTRHKVEDDKKGVIAAEANLVTAKAYLARRNAELKAVTTQTNDLQKAGLIP